MTSKKRKAHEVSGPGDAGKLMGLDIGGTLVKLVFFEARQQPSWCDGSIADTIKSSTAYGSTGNRDCHLSFEDEEYGGTFHFLYFASDRMEQALAWVHERNLEKKIHRLCTAGGGAHKFSKHFKEQLGIELVPVDELGVIVNGISWMAERFGDEVYWIDLEASQRHYLKRASLFPFLLVNVGSGVSIVRVDSNATFKRVSGTALGGGTFWGLCQLLTGCKSFEEAMEMAASGDASSVNMSVKDIYGGDYKMPNGGTLKGSLTASFFAKAGRHDGNPPNEDVLCALTTMIAQNVCQLSYLNSQLQGVDRIVFTGNFLRHNKIAQETIARNMRAASLAQANGKEINALFLTHEGYFGAIGSLLYSLQDDHLTCTSSRATLGSSA